MTVTLELLNGAVNDIRNAASQLRRSTGDGSQNAAVAVGADVLAPIANTLDAAGDRLAGAISSDPNFSGASNASTSSSSPSSSPVVGSITPPGANAGASSANPSPAPNPSDQSGAAAAAADVGETGGTSPSGARTLDAADLRRTNPTNAGASSSSPSPATTPAGDNNSPQSAPSSSTAPGVSSSAPNVTIASSAPASSAGGDVVQAQIQAILDRLARDEQRLSALETGAGNVTGELARLEGAAAAAADVGRRQ